MMDEEQGLYLQDWLAGWLTRSFSCFFLLFFLLLFGILPFIFVLALAVGWDFPFLVGDLDGWTADYSVYKCFCFLLFLFQQGLRTDLIGWFWHSCISSFYSVSSFFVSHPLVLSLYHLILGTCLGRHVSWLRTVNKRRATCGFCLVMIRHGYGMVRYDG